MSDPVRITSRQHPIVKRCRALAGRRSDDGTVLLDGEHLVVEALRAGIPIDAVIVDVRHATLGERARAKGIDVFDAVADVLDAASPARTASGIVAIARWEPAPLAAVLSTNHPFVIGLVDVQDPGNVGSIIRSAEALGASGLVALGSSADPGGWKALRGAMGSTFRLPIARGDLSGAIEAARRASFAVTATVATHGERIDDVDLRQPTLLLLGNEGAGLPGDALDAADRRVTIPVRGDVESLNVAATAAIVCYEARRQRSAAGHPIR